MMIAYRNCDARFFVLWESSAQPASRWNRAGDGPVQYLADTPTGAWAEFLRHEEITDPEDIAGVERAFWVVDIGDEVLTSVQLPDDVATGAPDDTYLQCQEHARDLKQGGATALVAPSAALNAGAAHGFRVEQGRRNGPSRDGRVIALFGPRPLAICWQVVGDGHPPEELLARVRHIQSSP